MKIRWAKETDDESTTINVLFGFRFYALLSIFVDLSREILLCPAPASFFKLVELWNFHGSARNSIHLMYGPEGNS